jgi:hypothetical protein
MQGGAMNRDDIIRIAMEAFGAEHELFWMNGTDEYLERFANLVAAAEREACAKMCEAFSVDRGMIRDETLKTGVFSGASMCALAIRERGAP